MRLCHSTSVTSSTRPGTAPSLVFVGLWRLGCFVMAGWAPSLLFWSFLRLLWRLFTWRVHKVVRAIHRLNLGHHSLTSSRRLGWLWLARSQPFPLPWVPGRSREGPPLRWNLWPQRRVRQATRQNTGSYWPPLSGAEGDGVTKLTL